MLDYRLMVLTDWSYTHPDTLNDKVEFPILNKIWKIRKFGNL